MPPQLSEDEVDDLLYYARTGDTFEFQALSHELCTRENTTLGALLPSAIDTHTGNGPLHMAAANGHTELLRTLITALVILPPTSTTSTSTSSNNTANPPVHPPSPLNAQNLAGNTPLHWAALNGHLECVKALLDHGADPTLVNGVGHDAVYEAELGERTEVVEWVLREGGEGLEVGVGGGGEGLGEGGEEEEGRQGEGDGDAGEGSGIGGMDTSLGDGDGDVKVSGQGNGGGGGIVGSVVGNGAEMGIREGMGGLSLIDGVDHL